MRKAASSVCFDFVPLVVSMSCRCLFQWRAAGHKTLQIPSKSNQYLKRKKSIQSLNIHDNEDRLYVCCYLSSCSIHGAVIA